jgi:hypothetical protein
MKIKDLPNWPPEPGGAFKTSYKSPSSDHLLQYRLRRPYGMCPIVETGRIVYLYPGTAGPSRSGLALPEARRANTRKSPCRG